MIQIRRKLFTSLYPVIILIFITIITYINILPNKLFFDDEELIYKNNFVRDLRFFPKYFTTNMIAGAGKISNMYRPVLTTSIALDYFIWKDNPVGYHLTSIILHISNTLLIFFLVKNLFGNLFISFFTSILFSVHPALSEAVIYASGRTDPLYSFFLLISLLFFQLSIKSGKFIPKTYIISFLAFILSLLSKETAIILPFLLPVVLLAGKKVKNIGIKKYFLLLLPFFLTGTVYFILRLTVLNFSNTLNFYPADIANTDIFSYSTNIIIRLFSFTKIFFDYLFLLFIPVDLNIAREALIIKSLNIWVLFFLFTIIALFIFSLKFYGKNKIYLFSFFWFFISIFPVSGIIPINNISAEHYLYLPSVAFFVTVAYIVNDLSTKIKSVEGKTILAVFSISIVLLLLLRTIIRTYDWRDPITFYTRSLAKSPGNLPMRHNLAMSYAESGQLDLAVKEYQYIIAARDVYPNTHHNLANAYVILGKFREAEIEYKKALLMDPHFIFSYYGLKDLYQKTGDKKNLEAINHILQKL